MALVSRGLCESREKAKRLILAGKARIGRDHVIQKASEIVSVDADLNIEEPCPYVSRGAYKLLEALEKHLPNPEGLVSLDVGASTGGFTDLLLSKGVVKAFTVDVGRGQLHGKLRNDPRVVCHEQVNARHLEADFLPEQVDIIVMDVSFISVEKVLPATSVFLKKGGWAFILVKPQFEAERSDVGKGGVVRDDKVRTACVEKVARFAESELSWVCVDKLPSPIKGPKGNQEYILVFRA